MQGTRILDLACDIAADRAEQPCAVWAAVENDIVGHSHVRWKAQSLFRIAVFSAWLRAHAPRVRFMLRPFLRAISGVPLAPSPSHPTGTHPTFTPTHPKTLVP